MGSLVDRTHRELTADDIDRVAGTYHSWREPEAGAYEEVAGFCKSATVEEIAIHRYVLVPSRYTGPEEPPPEDEPFKERFQRLASLLEEQLDESEVLDATIRDSLRQLTA